MCYINPKLLNFPIWFAVIICKRRDTNKQTQTNEKIDKSGQRSASESLKTWPMSREYNGNRITRNGRTSLDSRHRKRAFALSENSKKKLLSTRRLLPPFDVNKSLCVVDFEALRSLSSALLLRLVLLQWTKNIFACSCSCRILSVPLEISRRNLGNGIIIITP